MSGTIRKHVATHKHVASDIIGNIQALSVDVKSGRGGGGYDGYGTLPIIGEHNIITSAELLSYMWGLQQRLMATCASAYSPQAQVLSASATKTRDSTSI